MGHHNPASDAELVQSLINGEDAAGAELFEKYAARVYYLALREIRSHADAQDVRSETFLRVFKAIRNRQLRSPDALGSFILGTARLVILETFRSPHRAGREPEMPDLPAPEPTAVADEEVREAIDATLRRLKPREQEFLRLHYYEDLPKEEIARRIGIDEERVRLIKHRSLKNFREMYERLKRIADTKRGGLSLKV